MIGSLAALRKEVEETCVLNCPDEPPMRAPQIQLLDHFAIHCPDLFQKKLHVPPETFNDILDQISNHHVFHNQSNNPQLPVAVQLTIFLVQVGHCGNASSPENISQWAGVSVGSVINCTNHVMAALLVEHDNFISFPTLNSVDAARTQAYALKTSGCPEWQNGILAVDGSLFNLYQRPGLFGDAFYSRKSQFSLNCQICFIFYFFYLRLIFLIFRRLLCPIILL